MDVFDQVVEQTRGYLRAALAQAAYDLGLFDGLRDSATPAALAEVLDLPRTSRLVIVLDAMVMEGWLARTQTAAEELVYTPAALPDRSPERLPATGWGALAAVLTTGKPEEEATDGPILERYQEALWDGGANAAKEVATRFLCRTSTLLDVAGGAGVYTCAYLREVSDGVATLVDRAPVADIAERRLGDDSDRVQIVADDVFEWTEPRTWDTILLANVTHLFGADDCCRLVRHLFTLLSVGGRLIIKDFRLDDGGLTPVVSVLFSVNMVVYTESGKVHSVAELSSYVESAGGVVSRVERLATSPSSVVLVAHRASESA